jgi:hypothetical protein
MYIKETSTIPIDCYGRRLTGKLRSSCSIREWKSMLLFDANTKTAIIRAFRNFGISFMVRARSSFQKKIGWDHIRISEVLKVIATELLYASPKEMTTLMPPTFIFTQLLVIYTFFTKYSIIILFPFCCNIMSCV